MSHSICTLNVLKSNESAPISILSAFFFHEFTTTLLFMVKICSISFASTILSFFFGNACRRCLKILSKSMCQLCESFNVCTLHEISFYFFFSFVLHLPVWLTLLLLICFTLTRLMARLCCGRFDW